MSKKEINRFLDYTKSDYKTANKISNMNKEELAKFISDSGYDFSLDELEAYKKELTLSDDELSSVAGGSEVTLLDAQTNNVKFNCNEVHEACGGHSGDFSLAEQVCSGGVVPHITTSCDWQHTVIGKWGL